jgi:hypothetical protein
MGPLYCAAYKSDGCPPKSWIITQIEVNAPSEPTAANRRTFGRPVHGSSITVASRGQASFRYAITCLTKERTRSSTFPKQSISSNHLGHYELFLLLQPESAWIPVIAD